MQSRIFSYNTLLFALRSEMSVASMVTKFKLLEVYLCENLLMSTMFFNAIVIRLQADVTTAH